MILFLLGMLTIFSFWRQGVILIRINNLIWYWLGGASFVLPFLFWLLGLVFSRLKTPLREPNVLVGAWLSFVSFLGLFRTGRLGQWLWAQTAFLITGLGAASIFLGGLLIGLVVLFDTSLSQLIQLVIDFLRLVKKYLVGVKSKRKKRIIFNDGLKEESEERSESLAEAEPGLARAQLPLKPLGTKAKTDQKLKSTSTKGSPKTEPLVWQYPPLELLRDDLAGEADRGNVRENAQKIEDTLESFGIRANVVEVNRGPSVTQYALKVASGVKLSKILALSNDLALALAAPTGQIRIEAPIPGRSLVGIEVPNRSPAIVPLKKMLTSSLMKQNQSKLAVPLGLDVAGKPRVAEINRMPHVLIAGQTGSGKSVLLNAWISTILFRATPKEVKLILVDPKRVELTRYQGVPHLMTPPIVEPEKVVSALKWAIGEMNRRYEIFAIKQARNLEIYNQLVEAEEQLPYIVIVIDELADIMLFAPTEVEDSICRLAQMARATGIHLVLATQRPSVDVLTGLIKANIPCRISFAVASLTDSRVILDTPGAERLLGRGDMLYIPPNQAKPARIQGAFISDEEVKNLIDFLSQQAEAEYQEEVVSQPVTVAPGTVVVNGEERDTFFDQAVEVVRAEGRASASLLQRRLKVGYARAARILDQLEAAGIVGPAQGSKPREVIG